MELTEALAKSFISTATAVVVTNGTANEFTLIIASTSGYDETVTVKYVSYGLPYWQIDGVVGQYTDASAVAEKLAFVEEWQPLSPRA